MKKFVFPIFLLSFSIISAQETTKKDTLKTQSIQEVLMTKKVFKKESDRFVYDISNSPIAKGNTTFDILKQTPLLSSIDDKSLKIAGKNNAIIYINGRKSNMDAESLAQFLQNTPAENIQKIEIITMPGSEFQVESSDGIINIVLKKKMTDGLNGNMRMSASANKKFSSNSASFSANYRKEKLGVSANLSGSENIQAQDFLLKNGTDEAFNTSIAEFEDPNKNLGGYLNIDYQLTDQSNLALSWNTWANKSYDSRSQLFNSFKYFDEKENQFVTNYTRTKNLENARSYNNNLNLNYELKTDSLGSKLNLNAAYLNYKRFQNANNYTYASTVDGIDGGLTRHISQNIPQVINNFSGMADYIQKFKNDFTISVGGNYNKTKTDNDTKNITTIYDGFGNLKELYDTDGNRLENPKNEPNHFIYDENIYGMYLTLEKKISEKFSGKVGARYEITKSIGTSDNPPKGRPDMAKVEQNYNNLLPYISLNYGINENNTISYAFSSRMRRPSFWEINPTRENLTENNYTQNNPFVKASSTYNQELTYMYKNSYFLILNHSMVKDQITQVPLQRTLNIPRVDENNQPVLDDSGNQIIDKVQQLRYIRTNFGDSQEMSITLGINKSFFKQYWTTNFNAGVQHNRNNGRLSIDPTSGDVFPEYVNMKNSTSLMIQTNNTIRLDKAKTWFLGINYFFVDKQQIELGVLKPLQSLDVNIKKIWNSWTFAVDLRDIFRTNIVEIEDYQDNGNYNYVKNDNYRQGVMASITYNFGNQKVKKVRSIENAADGIKDRTR